MVGHLEAKAPLFRFVDSDIAVDNSTSGILWLRTFLHFAGIEDEERQDDREGMASGQIKGGNRIDWINEQNMVSPQYLMSFTECERSPKNWGRHRLKLIDVREFIERVRECMDNRCIVMFDKVQYSDEIDYERRPSGFEMWKRASLTKPTKYDLEKEWRLILVLNRFRIVNRTLKINVDVLSGVLEFCPERSSSTRGIT